MFFTRKAILCLLGLQQLSETNAFGAISPIGRQMTRVSQSSFSSLSSSTSRLQASDDDDDIECSLESDGASDCLQMEGYSQETSSFMTVTEVYVAQVESLRGQFPSFEDHSSGKEGSNRIKYNKRARRGQHILDQMDQQTPTPSGRKKYEVHENSRVANLEYNELVGDDEVVLIDAIRKPGMNSISRAFPRAGPREFLHFDPSKVNAAIVTCGGLCPGLNNVIRELVHSLYYLYGAKKVYGITGGFHGFHDPDLPPILLTNEMVENIHHEGGTVLRSSRGGFDMDKILNFLQEHDISQLYIIGGDGTHRGAYAIHQACVKRNLNIAVAGIPKTIDNDVGFLDRSFGFQSAVEAAQAGIRTAKTEAKCNIPRGIGLIKLMGRSAGFLAAFAALGSGDVDLVLVPEVPIVLEGPNGILPFLRRRIQEQKYAVVVVAEGAGEELLGTSAETDASGNKKLPKIGEFLQDVTTEYFAKYNEDCTIKYIDPSYTVRSVPANGADSLYCQQLATNAVHGSMAGLTGFSVGLVNKASVLLPIPLLAAASPRSLNPYGSTWERILALTGQPNTALPKPKEEKPTIDDTVQGTPMEIPEPTAH